MFKALKALIVGILAGTALGVLFSPKKGDEIRKNIKKEVKRGGTGLSTIVHTLSDMGKEIGESTSRTEAYKKAKAKTGRFVKSKISAKHRNQAKRVFNRAKETINKVKNNIASNKEE